MEKEKNKTWEEIGKAIYEEWANREPFRFSPAGDAAYTAQRDALHESAKRAASDAHARAVAATGGYGNSYATTASEAAYRKQSEGIADIIPSLYDLAYERYRDEGDELYDRMRAVNAFADDERKAAEEAEKEAQKEQAALEKEEEAAREEALHNERITTSTYWPEGLDPASVLVPDGAWRGVSIDEAYAVLLKAGAKESVLAAILPPAEWTRKKSFHHADTEKHPEIYRYDTYEQYLAACVNAALLKLR